MNIDDLRMRVDAIDVEILQLLNRRARLAIQIGKLKWRKGLPLQVPDRERDVLRRIWKLNEGPLNGRAVARLFRLIIRETRRLQEIRLGGKTSCFAEIRLRRNSQQARRRVAPAVARSREAVP
jgi:chorismate mutase-like protein